ncbi:SDR family oxidoreductase [Rhizobium leguminosarum]|uniref:SDR family oxidoreductase n=1 Tax=Rhizobium leguminosarum TaxID=384 RepID=UPI001C98CB9C|nr:SDR family oxidoreductase [Rhizobium leguminosarum]MBY5645489.1 SDR family oxidoreductase [Rhizobium leguminosarum]
MRDLQGASVVITGASSGIGRATALAFARSGARLCLAARRSNVLQEVVRDCQGLGSKAIAVPTDVTDTEAVAALARAADTAFGGIDVWVNNAGTGVAGSFHEAPLKLHRRTVEVNLLGAMSGAYSVLPIFMRQNHGILINTVSMAAWLPNPFAAAYTASKFGLRGFAASLRQELVSRPNIHICGVFPAVIDTPIINHGANFTGRSVEPPPFLYDAEDVAEAIVGVALLPRDEVAVGWPARAGQLAYAVARDPVERLMGATAAALLRRATPQPLTEGSAMAPIPTGTSTSGGWRLRKGVPSGSTITKVATAVTGALLLILGLNAVRPRRRVR